MKVALVMLLATVALVFAAPHEKRREGAKEQKEHEKAMNAGFAGKAKNTINAKNAMMSLYALKAMSSFAAEDATSAMLAENAGFAQNAEAAEESKYAMKAGEATYARYAYHAEEVHGPQERENPGKHAKDMLESVLEGLDGMVEETVKSLGELKAIEEKKEHQVEATPEEQAMHGVVGTAGAAYNTLIAGAALNAINAAESKHSGLAKSAHNVMMARNARHAMFARNAETATRTKAAHHAEFAMFALKAKHAEFVGTKEELKKLVEENGDSEEAEEVDVWKHDEPPAPEVEAGDEMDILKEEMENFHPAV